MVDSLSERPTIRAPGPRPMRRLVEQASEPPQLPRRRPLPRALWIATAAAVSFGAVLAVIAAPELLAGRSNPGSRPARETAPESGPASPVLAGAPATVGPRNDLGERLSEQRRTDTLEVVKLAPVVVALPAGGSQPTGSAQHTDVPGAIKSQGEAARAPSHPHPSSTARRREKLKRSIEQEILEIHQILPELKASDVGRVVDAQRPRMQQCYVRALRVLGTPRDARVDLTVDIAPTGEVQAASVDGDSLPTLAPCLNGLAQQWRFPASREGATVPIPLSFTAKP